MAPVSANVTKVLSLDELLTLRAEAREAGRTVVQCHGCFDIVHPGHVRHLRHAAEQGDILLVSITADAVMRKGEGRPTIGIAAPVINSTLMAYPAALTALSP